MKKDIQRFFLSIAAIFALCFGAAAQESQAGAGAVRRWEDMKRELNFFMVNDTGRNGYYDQKPIAALMGDMAEVIGPECILAVGDVHHFDGVQSVSDPLWMTNYELIYDHPELMIAWHPVLGNHEYRGDTGAVLDYSKVSRRWEMPARYYTTVFEEDSVTVRFVMLDTVPLIDKYREDGDEYPDVGRQDMKRQLAWADSVLTVAAEDWVIVMGHHPIYAETSKDESERNDMQERVDAMLRRHRVDIYACGHIHNFQHIRVPGSDIDYVVNSAGALSRKVKPTEVTLFCSSETGFSVICADETELDMHLVDRSGEVLYTVSRRK